MSVATIRWFTTRDLRAVLAIERESFDDPWSAEEFLDLQKNRNAQLKVVECDGRIVGYVIYRLGKCKIDLLNIAVHEDYRRRRIGTVMLQSILDRLTPHGKRRLCVEIMESNLDGLKFLAACGLRAVNVIRQPYDYLDDDAILMVYRVGNERMCVA